MSKEGLYRRFMSIDYFRHTVFSPELDKLAFSCWYASLELACYLQEWVYPCRLIVDGVDERYRQTLGVYPKTSKDRAIEWAVAKSNLEFHLRLGKSRS